MNRAHARLGSRLVLFVFISLATLAGCGPELTPEAPPPPTAERAPRQAPAATPTSTAGAFQSPISTPAPTNTFPPPPTVTPEPPTPTVPPVPTPLPTPVVTRVPTAAPPIIPLPAGQVETPYRIAFRTGSVVRTVRNDGTDHQVLLDVHAQTLLFLVSRDLGVGTWGSPSPDGSQLALVLSNVESHESLAKGEAPVFAIYLFDLATQQLRPLVEDGVEPVWSPDSTRIAYRSTRTQGMWIVDVATGEQREVYPVEYEHTAINFDWAPDGSRLVLVDSVFRQSSTMVVVEENGSGFAPVDLSPDALGLFFPQWSPDGGKILYFSPGGERLGQDYPYNVWIMNPDGSGQTQLTRDISVAGIPHWSPAGDWISFTGTQLYEEREPYIDLWLIDPTGDEPKRVTSNEVNREIEAEAVWSPGGAQLVLFVADLNEVRVLSLADGVQTELSPVTRDFVIIPSAE